ncbi:DUF4377 domain-containing protein [Flavivirga rizhaonensis]|nr:DUF4377 domain-containing protein [Flavivirga rizhaonensis]
MKILFLMIIVILFSCSSDNENQTQTIDMRINHYQNTGIGEGLFLTFLVQEGNNIGTNNWTKLYGEIEGFNYEPGNIYNLSVIIESTDNPLADGSSLKYILKEIKSTQAVDNETLFDIDLKINGQSFVTTNSGYELLNQIEINCNTLCDELDVTIQNQDFVVGTFKRLPNNEIQLIELK